MKTAYKFTVLFFALLIGASAQAQMGTLFQNKSDMSIEIITIKGTGYQFTVGDRDILKSIKLGCKV